MKQHTKEVIQYGSAIAMIATGIILAVASFIWLRLIHSSVLAYMGEAVGFAGAVYGLSMYSRSNVNDMKAEMENFKCEIRRIINPDEEIQEDNENDN